jgi:hypothetical protein
MSTVKTESQPLFERTPAEAKGEIAASPVPTINPATDEKPAKKKPGPPKGYVFKGRGKKAKAKVATKAVTKTKTKIKVKAKTKIVVKKVVAKKATRADTKQFGITAPVVKAAQDKVARLHAELTQAISVLTEVEHHAALLESLIS